jgi:hypothetical protein
MLLSNLYTSKLLKSPSRLSFPSIHSDHGSIPMTPICQRNPSVFYIYLSTISFSIQPSIQFTVFLFIYSIQILPASIWPHPATTYGIYLRHPSTCGIRLITASTCLHPASTSNICLRHLCIYLQHPLVDSFNLPTISRCLRCCLDTIISSTSNYFRERCPIFAKVFVTPFAKTYFWFRENPGTVFKLIF